MNCKDRQRVTIKKMVNGGYGLATQPGGKAVLVHRALPDEVVTISLGKQYPGHDFAHIISIDRAHPGRVEPPCRYYADCGGCDLQHADYATQCAVKQEIMADLTARSRNETVRSHSTLIQPIAAAPQPFGYRQRIRLQIDATGIVGFHRIQSHSVVGIATCLLAHPAIAQALTELGTSPSFARLTGVSSAVELLLNPADSTVCVLAVLRRPPRPTDRTDAERLCENSSALTRVFLAGGKRAPQGPYSAGGRSTDRSLTMDLTGNPPLRMQWEVGGFSQVNILQNQTLIDLVIQRAAPTSADSVLDLFCGTGNLSLPLARSAGRILGIEVQPDAIRHAQLNCQINNLDNTRFKQADVADFCTRLAASRRRFDIVVCDPPRRGIPGLSAVLAQICSKRLVYVSCDPATLCRDLGDLTASGFRLIDIQPVDMFPQTHHIETVALLEKN